MAHAFVDDPIDLVFVIIPSYPDVIIASDCKTMEPGTHLVADLPVLILCTSDLYTAG